MLNRAKKKLETLMMMGLASLVMLGYWLNPPEIDEEEKEKN